MRIGVLIQLENCQLSTSQEGGKRSAPPLLSGETAGARYACPLPDLFCS